MYGGADSDTIDGGDGDDELYGGNTDGSDDGAQDILKGGKGFDTYYAGAGDTIIDSDGKGQIYTESPADGGVPLSGLGIKRTTLIPDPPYLLKDATNLDLQYLSPISFSTELYK